MSLLDKSNITERFINSVTPIKVLHNLSKMARTRTKHVLRITKPYSINPSSPNFKGRFNYNEVRNLRNSLAERTAGYTVRIGINFDPTLSVKNATVEAVVSDPDNLIRVIDEIGNAGYIVRNYSLSGVEEERQ